MKLPLKNQVTMSCAIPPLQCPAMDGQARGGAGSDLLTPNSKTWACTEDSHWTQ